MNSFLRLLLIIVMVSMLTAENALSDNTVKLASRQPVLESKVHIDVRSTDFQHEGELPVRLTGQGENASPQISWSEIPSKTKSLVLICEDPDAPRADAFVHWILYGIPPVLSSLPAKLDAVPEVASVLGARQGRNSFGKVGYLGPMPPPGHGVHHYHFQLFALDNEVHIENVPEISHLLKVMEGHVLAVGDLVGTYERK